MGVIIFFVVVAFIWKALELIFANRGNSTDLPTVDTYMQQHNPTKGRGIACYKCGGRQIWNTAPGVMFTKYRIYYCKQCDTKLYRVVKK